MKKLKKKLKMCALKGVLRLDLATGKSPKWHTCEACRELKGHDSWSTIGQKVQSAWKLSHDSNSRLVPITRPSH